MLGVCDVLRGECTCMCGVLLLSWHTDYFHCGLRGPCLRWPCAKDLVGYAEICPKGILNAVLSWVAGTSAATDRWWCSRLVIRASE